MTCPWFFAERNPGEWKSCSVSAITSDSSAESVTFAQTVPFAWASVGVHPHDAKTVLDGDYKFLDTLRSSPKVVAWGEIGLDYYRDLSPRPLQQEIFRAQIRLARQAKLPIIVHERDAHADLLAILEEEQAKEYWRCPALLLRQLERSPPGT